MLVLAGIVLAVLAAGASALQVLAIAAGVGGRWKAALITFLVASGSFIVVGVLLALTARVLLSTDVLTAGVGPEVKARFLAENISGLMNVTVLGLPGGLLIGILLVWRRRLRTRAH
jgi:hypothetical protein